MAAARISLVALAALAVSCAPPAPPVTAPPVAVAAPPPATTAPPAPRGPRLSVTLRPLVEPSLRIQVEVVAEGEGADLRAWALGEGSPSALRDLTARDDDGPVSFQEDHGALSLARAPRGAVHVRHELPAAGARAASPLAALVIPSAMRATGEALLLLPVAYDEKTIPTTLRIDADALGATGAASSLGIGVVKEQPVRGRFLRHAAFIAGQLGTAVFHTMEAEDEAAWIGVTAFDPRAAASEAAIVRGVVETFFGGHEVGPMPLLVVGHVNPQRLLAMSRRSNSMLLNVGMAEPWGPAPRIAIAHQVVQKWIGGAVWVGPDDPVHEAESYWFSEGVARFFARAILFRVGLLEADELRDSVAADLATLLTSPLRGERNAEVASHVASEGAMALLVARGSLYALGVDARIRDRTAHKKSLDAVMLALLRDAREGHRRVLPQSAWTSALRTELGEDEVKTFADSIVEGHLPPIPADALGPCFRRTEGRYARFDLGFDEPATRAAAGHTVTGLERGGPAERAGVRAGDALVSATFDPGWAQGPAKLELTRAGKPLVITYLPAGESVKGPAWTRRKELSNEKCKP